MKQCSVADCGGKFVARGLCKRHLHRFYKHGDPLKGQDKATSNGEAQAFLERAWATETDDCILWPYANVNGYPVLLHEGRMSTGARVICKRQHGAPPTPKHEAAHSCNARPCLNKRHLRWATSKENKHDQLAHGTRRRGTMIDNAVITADIVREMRALSPRMTGRAIAAQFGVSKQVVSKVLRRETWAWVA